MKKYVLDTNICIHFLKGEYDLDQKVQRVGAHHCYISEITLAELEFGVENSNENYKEENRKVLISFSRSFEDKVVSIRSCFSIYAKQKARLRKAGQMIGEFDMLIGCSAVANDMIMVTRNVRELERIEGIIVENWIDK